MHSSVLLSFQLVFFATSAVHMDTEVLELFNTVSDLWLLILADHATHNISTHEVSQQEGLSALLIGFKCLDGMFPVND